MFIGNYGKKLYIKRREFICVEYVKELKKQKKEKILFL